MLKEKEPRKWRAYLLGVWQRQQKKHPDLQKLYDTRLSIAQNLVQTALRAFAAIAGCWSSLSRPVEAYHEEGKAEGLDQYQLREFGVIQRHVVLVAVVYSLLRTAQHAPNLQIKLQRQLKINLDGSPAAWR